MTKPHPLPEGVPLDGVDAGTDDAAVVERDISSLEQELAERHEHYLRLAADFENFKRRKTQEMEDRSRYSSEGAALALLPVLDNLRRSMEHAPTDGGETVANFVSGIEMVIRDFEAALERIGIQPIATVGEVFDPAVHEAIGGEESPDVDHDTVVAELQRGYRLHDRVLRPALVRIARPVHSASASE